MNKLRDLWRASWLLALFAVAGLFGLFSMAFVAITSWTRSSNPKRGDDIITPVDDHQVPNHLQPIVAIRREAALVRNYRGPIVWYFRGNVTLKDFIAEYGHARVLRKIFDQQTDSIWPNQPMLVFWSPWEILGEWDDDLKMDWGSTKIHQVSLGRAMVLYLLLLWYHRSNGRSALPSGCWLRAETSKEGHQICIGYGDWMGYKVHMRSDSTAGTHHYRLGIEPAKDFHLKRVA